MAESIYALFKYVEYKSSQFVIKMNAYHLLQTWPMSLKYVIFNSWSPVYGFAPHQNTRHGGGNIFINKLPL